MKRPAPGEPCLVDGRELWGEEAALPLGDPALQAGLGLFETLRVAGGRVLRVEAHLARLERGAARLAIGAPPPALLSEWIARTAARIASGEGWVKLILSGAGRVVVYGGPLESDPSGGREPAEVRAVLLPWRRSLADPLAGIKSLAGRAANELGLVLAARRGAEEGLWRNSRGHLTEACSANLFVVRRGKLYTAAEGEGLLPGIVRAEVLRLAAETGWTVHTGKLRLWRLREAEEAFLTSSVRGVRPLVAVDGRRLGSGHPGPLTRWLAGRLP